MIGFGLMDNLVMIQAGDLIDSTIGVTLGLSTLTAAAFGQVVRYDSRLSRAWLVHMGQTSTQARVRE
jgi:hypothetical protein